MELENNRINQVIETAIQNLNTAIDVNTVMGEPIVGKNGEYIVPFSKITFGVIAGGGEYGKISLFKKASDLPYSAGNGAIVSLKPCGFLIKNNIDDSFKVVTISDTPYEKIIEKASDFIDNISKK